VLSSRRGTVSVRNLLVEHEADDSHDKLYDGMSASRLY